jgi:hypothetical protein
MYKLLGSRPKRGAGFLPVIVDIVAKSLDMDPKLIHKKSRKREIVEARQMCMTYAKNLTTCSLAKIGLNIGGKDHATVLHSVKTVNNLIETDSGYKARYDMILNNILSYVDNTNNFVCPICGGIDVMIKAWVNPNLDKFVKHLDEIDSTSTFCNKCNAHVELILGKEFDYDAEHSVEAISSIV